jgi:hypothetical protein
VPSLGTTGKRRIFIVVSRYSQGFLKGNTFDGNIWQKIKDHAETKLSTVLMYQPASVMAYEVGAEANVAHLHNSSHNGAEKEGLTVPSAVSWY